MSARSGRTGRALALGLAAAALLASGRGQAQTREAIRTKYEEPKYPEQLYQEGRQGNVLFAGRIDAEGRISDLHMLATSNKDFVEPALAAVLEWQFQPALRDGKPIEVFANVAVRFRIPGEKRGWITAAILGDLAISPADDAGKATAPEGFPIRRGKDPAFRAQALLDVPPSAEARTLTVNVEAVSPRGKKVPIFQPPIAVPANAREVRFPVVAKIGSGWDEGVWVLRFSVNGLGVGGGLFWLADDPAHFQFVIPASTH